MVIHRTRIAPTSKPRKSRTTTAGLCVGCLRLRRPQQHRDAQQRREHHRDEPRHEQRDGRRRRRSRRCIRRRSSARSRSARSPPIGDEACRSAWRRPASCRRRSPPRSLSSPSASRVDHGVDRSSWRRRPAAPSAMISAPSEMRCRSMSNDLHDRKDDGERQRDRQRDDGARPDAQADEADRHDDGDGLPQRLHELADGVIDVTRLVRDQMRLDAERQVGRRSSRIACCDVAGPAPGCRRRRAWRWRGRWRACR